MSTKKIRLATGGIVELPTQDAVLLCEAGRAEPYIEGSKVSRANERPQLVAVGDDLAEGDPTGGFKTFGDLLVAVRQRGLAARDGVPCQDARLDVLAGITQSAAANKAAHTKTVGSDEYATVEEAIGGFLIPPQHDPRLLTKKPAAHFVRDNNPMHVMVSGQMVTFTVEKDTNRTSGNLYGGVDCYWLKERGQMTPTKGTFEQVELVPKALTALTYATDAQLHYAAQTSGILARQFDIAMRYKELAAFMEGTGAGEPAGILNAACKYQQAAETEPSSQAAATIVVENVLKMYAHMYEPDEAVWLTSHSCFEMLNTMTIDVGTGGAPIALMNIDSAGIRRVLGRPIIFNEFSKAIGTEGDLMFVNWQQYILADGTYANTASSIHVRFDYNETAFRFVKQVDGQPWWRSSLTLQNSWELSPIVTLAART